MLINYIKVAFRNLVNHTVYSFINIVGLATGMAVTILIGLWIFDEFSYNKYFKNYDRIVQVWQNNIYNGTVSSQVSNPAVMAEETRSKYGSDFKYMIQSSWNSSHILTHGEKKFNLNGSYCEPEITELLTLNMIKGMRDGLKDPHSILLSASTAKTFFGDADPMNQMIRIDNQEDVKVTGVYEDIPYNCNFRDMHYILPWELYLITNKWVTTMTNPWGSNFTQTFGMLADHVTVEAVSAKIHDVKLNKVAVDDRRYNPQVFLHPMSKWNLYSDFKNGKNVGGRIEFVWLFGVIGVFVLLLACINFMNLSTARSEKRAKEVGIRKSIGSARKQLILQFFSESVIVAILAFILSLLIVFVTLPAFNAVADKKLQLPVDQLYFWAAGIVFTILTGIVAGSYPALYLSSFQPVKVLKGTFRAGKFASAPRKVLVVVQFAVSVTLIIGTVVVFRQIEFAKNRPIGYDQSGLINIFMSVDDIHKHWDSFRAELKSSGAVVEMAESGSPTTNVWNSNGGFDWQGKDPAMAVDFPNNDVTYEYGNTVGWTFKEGRDFSREHATDSLAFIINETTVKYLGFKEPVGETLKWDGKNYTIIGVINDMVIESPYEPVRPQLYHISKDANNVINIKLSPTMSAHESIAKVEAAFKKYSPASPFEYHFVDADYQNKFWSEVRVGKLAGYFAVLAIVISCLGIFGLASFVAEQRTKEIGVRKVMGASVFLLWRMLSTDFVILVFISFVISAPVSWYFMHSWLQKYNYRTGIPWWIFIAAGAGALTVTLLTVSYQSIKAARANPVKSLRSE